MDAVQQNSPAESSTGSTGRRPLYKPDDEAYRRAYGPIFPFQPVRENTELLEVGTTILRSVGNNPSSFLDLVVVGGTLEARGKVLYALARISKNLPVSAQPMPRRRDRCQRFRVMKASLLNKAESRLMVSAQTDPENLAKALSARLVLGDSRERAVEMTAMGMKAAGVAALALENFRFESSSDVRIQAALRPKGDGAMLTVQVEVVDPSDSLPPGAEDSLSGDEADGQAEALEVEAEDNHSFSAIPCLNDWTPSRRAALFTEHRLFSESSILGTTKAIAQTLSVHSTRIVEAKLVSTLEGPLKLFAVLATMPKGLQVVGQLAPKQLDERHRCHLIKDYPLKAGPETEVLRVSGSTDPGALSAVIRAKLLPIGEQGAEAVHIDVVGAKAARVAFYGIDQLQRSTKRELSFKVDWVKDSEVTRSMRITLVAT